MSEHYMSYEKALQYAMHMCSKAEKCKSDVIRKLHERNANPTHILKIIKTLEEEKYIDELRYTKFYVRDKFKFNKWGKVKIRTMLLQKQISEQIINEGLSEIEENEYLDMLKNVIKIKEKSISKNKPFTKKNMLFNHALSKGFESAIISKILGN